MCLLRKYCTILHAKSSSVNDDGVGKRPCTFWSNVDHKGLIIPRSGDCAGQRICEK